MFVYYGTKNLHIVFSSAWNSQYNDKFGFSETSRNSLVNLHDGHYYITIFLGDASEIMSA